jgi:hypothetical protein
MNQAGQAGSLINEGGFRSMQGGDHPAGDRGVEIGVAGDGLRQAQKAGIIKRCGCPSLRIGARQTDGHPNPDVTVAVASRNVRRVVAPGRSESSVTTGARDRCISPAPLLSGLNAPKRHAA